MNKKELSAAVSKKSKLSEAEASAAIDAMIEAITEEMIQDGEVRLLGFGNFVVSQRAATKGRNPKTQAEIDIPASRVARFKPGKALKDALNN